MSEHRLKSVRNSLTRMPSGFDPHELDAFQFAPSGSSSPAALGVAATAPATSNTRVAQVPASLLSSPWHTSAYVSIRRHTSAYVAASLLSSPWHTSAYVSIRQHTLAYVSIRGGVAAVVALARSSSGVSIRTLVPVKQVKQVKQFTCFTGTRVRILTPEKSSTPAKLEDNEPPVLVKQVVK